MGWALLDVIRGGCVFEVIVTRGCSLDEITKNYRFRCCEDYWQGKGQEGKKNRRLEGGRLGGRERARARKKNRRLEGGRLGGKVGVCVEVSWRPFRYFGWVFVVDVTRWGYAMEG